jgi:AbiV family abortive infection protein
MTEDKRKITTEKEKLLKQAVQACLGNVEQYFKDAHLLVENGSYGRAFAFTVLGEEELSKAYVYYECSEGLFPETVVKKMGKNRGSHVRKQLLAATLVASFGFVSLFHEVSATSREEAKRDVKKYVQTIQRKLKDGKEIEKRWSRMLQTIKSMATSEEDKENGLYVDAKLEEGILKSPKTLEKQVVEERLSQAEELFQFISPFFKLTLTPAERQIAKAQLESSGILENILKTLE